MKKVWLFVLTVILFPFLVEAADVGTITATKERFRIGASPNYGRLYIVDWTASTNGEFSGSLATKVGDTSLCGYLLAVETIPGASGDRTTDLPTSYTMYLYDAYNYDVVGGSLVTRSASAAEKVVPSAPVFICEEITVSATGASNSKKGRFNIWITDGMN